jgi:hypothetical protein
MAVVSILVDIGGRIGKATHHSSDMGGSNG